MSIYKACDIRGRLGDELRVEHAARLGDAVVLLKGPVPVLVAGDGRSSTPELKNRLVERLVRAGCRVFDLGAAPTPLFYFARSRLSVDVGVMVTASHNPASDNGFKITLGPLPVTEEDLQQLAGLMESSESPPATAGGSYQSLNLLPDYIDFLCSAAPSLEGVKVVVDCAGGMACLAAHPLWAATGAQVNFLLDQVDPFFSAHAPNPAEIKNLGLLQQEVRAQGADLGVAYDGDADRVVFVDESGQPVTGDQAIVLFARDVLRGAPETVIYDQKCSRAVPEAVKALGGQAILERSGHTYIKRAFLQRAAAYAGEMSGHHFFREIQGDDGLYASLRFARLLQASGLPLSALAAGVPSYPITPDIRVPMSADEIDRVLEVLRTGLVAEASVSQLDGLRIEFADGWGLVRRSVTESVLTLRFEGAHPAALQRILQRVAYLCPLLRESLHISSANDPSW